MNNENTPAEETRFAQRFRSAVVSYGLRQIAVTALTLGYNIALTHYLMPADFGKVAVIMIVVNVAVLLADGGVGIYLIQRHAEAREEDLSRVTTIQLYASALLSVLCFMIAIAASFISRAEQVIWMVAVASISLPFLVLRGMALLLLQRTVRLNKVVIVEVLEEVVYAVTATGFAVYGAGAWSIVIAQLAKATIGCAVAVVIGKFRFTIVPIIWDEDLKQGFHFGFHYQAAQLINMARISVLPLFIVPVFGFMAGGFVDRAWYFSGAALSIILAVQKKTIFPYVARIQHNLEKIRIVIEDSIYVSSIIDKFMFLPLLIFAREIVIKIFGDQWLPMIPLLYWLLAGNIIFGALAGSLYPVAQGIGRPDLVSRFNLVGFILSWVLIVPFTLLLGITGVGVAGLLMWGVVHWLKTKIAGEVGVFIYYRQVIKPLMAFAFAWGCTKLLIKLNSTVVDSLSIIVLWLLIAYILYVISLCAFDWKRFSGLWVRFITVNE